MSDHSDPGEPYFIHGPRAVSHPYLAAQELLDHLRSAAERDGQSGTRQVQSAWAAMRLRQFRFEAAWTVLKGAGLDDARAKAIEIADETTSQREAERCARTYLADYNNESEGRQ
ncbi:MAG: hypothetical protein LLG14_19525 [Nocardiaceae bacterium]|nr:hypothetical protein [Nocardiaceae bacterium]